MIPILGGRAPRRAVLHPLGAALGATVLLAGCAWESNDPAARPAVKVDPAGKNAATAADLARDAHDIPQFLCLFGRSNPAAWAQARKSLRDIGTPMVHPDTMKLVDRTESPDAAEADRARRALARLGAILEQLALLDRRSDAETWDQVRDTLVQMGPDAKEQYMFYLLRKLGRGNADQLDRTRRALVELGPYALPYLKTFLASDKARVSARTQALMTMLQMGPKARADVDVCAASPDAGLRYCAATALQGDPDRAHAVPLLLQLSGDAGWATRAEALIGLGRMGDARAVSAVTGALSDSDAFVRTKAVESLGRLGATGAVPRIIALMNDPSATAEFRETAADTLHRLTGQRLGTNPGAWHEWLTRPRGGQ